MTRLQSWMTRPKNAERPGLARNPILDCMRRWKLSPRDVLWSLEHGAKNLKDKRSKALQAAAQVGTARLKPYEGEWLLCQSAWVTRSGRSDTAKLAAVIDHAVAVIEKLIILEEWKR